MRDRAATSAALRSLEGDWGPEPESGRGRRGTGKHSRSTLPGWLRSILFLETAPPRMARFDPAATQSARHMTRYENPSLARRFGSGAGRRFGVEPRRLEVLAMLLLLVVASVASVVVPAANVHAAPAATLTPDPQVDGDEPSDIAGVDDPTDMPVDGIEEPSDGPSVSIDPNATFTPWPSLPPTPTWTPPPTPRPPKAPVNYSFVALGDSLTAWPSSNPWPSRLDRADTHLRLVHNAGIPGNTTAEMRARLTRDVFDYKPQVMFLLGGTNDMGLGYNYSTIVSNLRAIVVSAKAHKIRVIVLLVPPDSYVSAGPKIDSINYSIINMANSLKVTYVDIHHPLENANGTYQPRYTSDGLHFSALGAQLVATTIYRRISRLGL